VTQQRNFRALVLGALLMAGLALPQTAAAQFSDGYQFLDAVRKSDTAKILEFLDQPGVTPVNTKDRTSGETGLIIAMGRRDLAIASYLLGKGARLELTDNSGRSALLMAVERRFVEGAQLLLSQKANPNQANGSGETPLIRAVQLGDIEMARLLLAAGADPSRRDTLAGMSAIDYAQRGNRVPGLLDLLQSQVKKAPSKAMQGPQL
jgi:uncharacterized protein